MSHNREKKGSLVGKVRWFNNEKGYGFISNDVCDDIFVHYSSVSKKGYKTLKEGLQVKFKLIETDKGLQAIDVNEAVKTTKL